MQRADAICTRASHRLTAADAFDRRQQIVRREIVDLRALGHRADKLARALDRELFAQRLLRIASFSGDSEEAQSAIFQGRKAVRDARRAAAALGLRVCGAP